MTQDEIISMAQEVWPGKVIETEQLMREFERFAALVAAHEREKEIKRVAEGHGWTQAHWTAYEESIVAAEREACAKVCDEYKRPSVLSGYEIGYRDGRRECAAAIRARGEE